jgi:glycine cleavage system aminomethyltransferase T
VDLYEAYMDIDMDGDGIPEVWKFTLGGSTILDKERIAKKPLHYWTPYRIPHKAIGLSVADGEPPLPTGAHAVETRGGARRSIGFVTSSYQSPVLGRPIALALVERGLSRMGETIEFLHLGTTRRATIAPVCAFDPEGTRIHG